jgi:hypothetical protein
MPYHKAGAHVTTVALIHTVVKQWLLPILAVGLVFIVAKLVPMIDKTEPPLNGMLGESSCEKTGVSYENPPGMVATTSRTWTPICRLLPWPEGVRQVSWVTDVHEVVAQCVAVADGPILILGEWSFAPKFVPQMVRLAPWLVGALMLE